MPMKNTSMFPVNPKIPKTEEEKHAQAIEFQPWREWLGMEIHPDVFRQYSDLEIIAHSLYEMTFIGFDEKEIQDELNIIQKSIEDYKAMTDEEKRRNMISFEDFFRDFKEEEGKDGDEER